MGLCHSDGTLDKNESAAVSYFEAAARQGHAEAQCQLGIKYMNGEGVVKDEAKGAAWLRKSAEQGSSNAQALLSICYQMGKGVEQNQAEADKWKRKANEGMQTEMNDQMKKYLAMTKDEKSILDGGPSTETVVRKLMGVYSVFESYYRDSSFTIERGKTLISKGYANIPVGCEMYPIKLSGTTSEIWYFYKDEFDAWKSVKKE
jgi:TPR repeat protein